MKTSLECWRKSLSFVVSGAFSSGNPYLYMPDSFLFKYLWVPFSTCIFDGSRGLGIDFTSSLLGNYPICLAPVQPSSIILNPAPGEKFNLTLNGWDEFLQPAATVATITVSGL